MSEEQQQTRGRKPTTPNIDNVIKAIERGDYDDRLTDLSTMVTVRYKIAQERVLEEVRRVFGEDADVVTQKGNNTSTQRSETQSFPTPPKPVSEVANPVNPFLEKGRGDAEAGTGDTGSSNGSGSESNDPLAHLDATERQMAEEPSVPGRGGAMISGLGPADMGD